MTFRAVCDTCGERPPRYETVSVLGPLDIARRQHCAECAARGEEAFSTAAPLDDTAGHFALGPIRFEDLRTSLTLLDGREPPELLVWLADQVRDIARHHHQSLPPDILAFVARHGSG